MAFRPARTWELSKPAAGTPLALGNDLARAIVGAWSFSAGGGSKAFDDLGQLNGAGTAITWTAGRNGGLVPTFNGTTSFFNLDTSNTRYKTFDGATAVWTVSFWFKTSQSGGDISALTPAGPHMIERRQQTTFQRQFAVGIHTGGVLGTVITDGGTGTSVIASAATVNDGVWHHAAVTRNGSATNGWKLYLDGKLVATATNSQLPGSGFHLTFGCRTTNAAGRSSFFNGSLDAFAIFNDSLTAREIRDLYERPTLLYAPPRRRDVMVSVAGAGNSIAVPAGSLTLTGLVPTVTATANNSVAVPKGALTLTGLVPTVTSGANQSVAVPAGALTLTGLAPTVTATANNSVAVPAGSLTLSGFAPTVSAGANQSIAVPVGSLSLTGLVPTVTASNNQSVAVPVGSLGLTGLAPTVTATQANNIQVPAGTLALTGYAPTVLGGIVVQTGTGGGVREGRGYFSFQRAKRREEDEAQVEAALESLPAPKAAAVKAVLAEDHTDVLAAIEREVVLTRKQRAQVREVAQLVTRLAEQEREHQAREQAEQAEQAEIQAEAQRQHQMAVAAEQQRVFRRRRHAALLLLLH